MNIGFLAPYLSVVEIILAIVIVVLVVVQSKGSDMSAFMGGGGDSSSFRTRRGLEATLHKVTIYFGITFFVITVIAFIAWGQFTR